MAVRDDVRQLATKKAQAAALPPGFSSAPPTNPSAVIAAPVPSKPANKGVKRFFVGPGGDWGDLASPAWWGRELGKVGKETFVDPARRAARAVDPTSNASPLERAAGISEGALLALDVATPLLPEGAIANSLRREAMERALDREVAGYAASGGGARYRGVLGIHGSSKQDLPFIKPQFGSFYEPSVEAAWFWDAQTSGFDPTDLMGKARQYAGPGGEMYVARFPRESIYEDFGPRLLAGERYSSTKPNYARGPGTIVGSVKLPEEYFDRWAMLGPERFVEVEDKLRQAMINAMTPRERKQMQGTLGLGSRLTGKRAAEQARQQQAARDAIFDSFQANDF